MANFGFSVDTAANWAANNPTPLLDEECVESDTGSWKLGDGVTPYNSLPYLDVGKKYVDTVASNAPTYGITTGQVLANRFDKLRGVYNLKSTNTRRTDIGLGRCQQGGMSEHVWIGDSASAGAVSAVGVNIADRFNAVPIAFRNALDRAGIPGNGTGFVRATDVSTFIFDPRWAYAGTWSNNNSYGYAGAVAATATFIPDKSGTVLDILWFNYHSGATAGVTTVTLDGTVIATLTSANTTGVWQITRVPNLNIVAGQSKIVYTVTTLDSFGLWAFAGNEVWTPGAGLRVHNIAQSGSTASGAGNQAWVDTAGLGTVYVPVGGTRRQVTDAASTINVNTLTSATAAFTTADIGKPVDHIVGGAGQMFPPNAYISGIDSATVARLSYLVNNTVTVANAYNTLSAQTVNIGRPPDCVHIELGANDLNQGVAVSTIIAAITTIRNRYPNSDCILHLPQEFNTSFVSAATTLAFQQALYALADTLDVPVYDWRDQIGTYANGSALGWYGDNSVHLASAAQAMIGSGLAALLGPGTGARTVSGQQQPYKVVPSSFIAGFATVAAGAWTWNRVDTTAGAMTVLLPLTPFDGTEVIVENTGTANTLLVQRQAAPDTIEGSASAITLNASERIKLTYRAVTGFWYMERKLWTATTGTDMRRDGNGRSQVVDPAVAADIANKNYVDGVNLKANLSGTAVTSGTTATKILSLSVPANSVAVGDTFKMSMHGVSSSTGTLIFKVHVGTAGTTADAVAWTSATSAAQVTNQRAGITDGLVQVRSTGAGGTAEAEALAYAQAALLPTVVAAAATVTAVTTGTWFITISVTCSVGTYTAQSATIRKG